MFVVEHQNFTKALNNCPKHHYCRGQFFYMNNQKNFYAVITSALLCRNDINDKEKLLIALINNLSNEKGYCWANNHYLADCLACDERTIQRCIANLEKKKIINRVMNLDHNGNLEFRALIVIDGMTSSSPTYDNSDITPYDKSVIHNNKLNKNKHKENSIYSFDDFWNLYNKKVDTKKCKDKFEKLSDKELKQIKSSLPDYIASTPDVQFRKNPLTYLNGKCWMDEIKKEIKLDWKGDPIV